MLSVLIFYLNGIKAKKKGSEPLLLKSTIHIIILLFNRQLLNFLDGIVVENASFELKMIRM